MSKKCFLFFCSFLLTSYFLQASSLGRSLHQIKQAFLLYEEGELSSPFVCPLESKKDLSSYSSRFYLYFYRSLGFYLESLTHQKKQDFLREEDLLKKALRDIKKALKSPYGDEKKAALWKESYQLALIDLAFRKKDFSKVASLCQEALSWETLSSEADVFSYLEKIHKFLGEKENPLHHEVEKRREELKVLSESFILRKIKTLMKSIRIEPFSEKSSLLRERISQIYPRIKGKKKRKFLEKNFLREIERNFDVFSSEELLSAAKVLRRKSHDRFALFVLEKTLKIYPKGEVSLEILFNIAGVLRSLGHYTQAMKTLGRILKFSKGTPHHEKVLYERAYIQHFLRKKNARGFFEAYLKEYPKGNYETISRYYLLTYDLKKSSKFSLENKKALIRFFERKPISYYSFLLGRKFPKLYNPILRKFFDFKKQSKTGGSDLNPGFKVEGYASAFKELKSFSLDEEAFSVLLKMRSRDFQKKTQLFLIQSFDEIGRLDQVVIQSMTFFNAFPDARSEITLQKTFPLFEKKLIQSVLKKQKKKDLNFLLIASLIRQESAFYDKAKSHVGARGLMQLMPRTAKEVAKRNGMKAYSLESRKDNITLGVSYLSRLVGEFKKVPYALSAYNAGPHRVNRWLKKRRKYSLEDYVETIPFKETSLYVKLIFRNYVVYQLLYGDRDITKVDFLF